MRNVCFRVILWCVALVMSSGSMTYGQDPAAANATVVLFTPGGHWRGTISQLRASVLLFGNADMMSNGFVFDGKEEIAKLSHSRYLVLHVSPGPHAFSANQTHKHPNAKETVTLNLQPGSVSYLALRTTIMNYGAGVFITMTSHLDPATCAEFAEDHAKEKSEPIEQKHVVEKFRGAIDASFDPTRCVP